MSTQSGQESTPPLKGARSIIGDPEARLRGASPGHHAEVVTVGTGIKLRRGRGNDIDGQGDGVIAAVGVERDPASVIAEGGVARHPYTHGAIPGHVADPRFQYVHPVRPGVDPPLKGARSIIGDPEARLRVASPGHRSEVVTVGTGINLRRGRGNDIDRQGDGVVAAVGVECDRASVPSKGGVASHPNAHGAAPGHAAVQGFQYVHPARPEVDPPTEGAPVPSLLTRKLASGVLPPVIVPKS